MCLHWIRHASRDRKYSDDYQPEGKDVRRWTPVEDSLRWLNQTWPASRFVSSQLAGNRKHCLGWRCEGSQREQWTARSMETGRDEDQLGVQLDPPAPLRCSNRRKQQIRFHSRGSRLLLWWSWVSNELETIRVHRDARHFLFRKSRKKMMKQTEKRALQVSPLWIRLGHRRISKWCSFDDTEERWLLRSSLASSVFQRTQNGMWSIEINMILDQCSREKWRKTVEATKWLRLSRAEETHWYCQTWNWFCDKTPT